MKESQIANRKSQRFIRKEQKNFLRFFLGFSFVVLLSVFSFTFYVSSAAASTGINNQINFQGKLVNSDGTNVADDTYSVVFTLYDASSGGTNLWDETQNVTTVDGVFQVSLGSVDTTLGAVNFNQDNLYLGIKVESDSEMTPRVRFSAVPYAFNAHALNGVTATQSASGFIFQGGTSFQSTASFTISGGVLTFQPGLTAGLTIQSNGANGLTLDTGGAAALSIGTTNATSMVLGSSSLGSLTLTTDGTGDSEVQLPAQSIGASEIVNDGLDFTEFSDSQTLDANTTISLSTLNYIFDLTSTGEFFIRDAGNNIAQFLADGTITFGKAASGGTINLGIGTGADTINIGTDTTVADILAIGNSHTSTTLALTGGDDWSISAAGAAVLASVTGAGLSDCDASTSKLLWNDATGTFSCGTDMGSNLQTIGLNDTTTESLTGTNTVILDNTGAGTTYLGITPADTSSKILINVTIRVDSDSTDSEVDVFEMRRTTDGTNPDCSSTLIGSAMEIETTNTDDDGWVAGNFVDSPSTTNQVRYTLCGMASGGTASNDTNQITLTLSEIGSGTGGGGGGNVSVRESDSSPSVATASTIEFGPSTTSSDEFIVTDEGSNVARIRLGDQVGLLNEAEIVTGGWTFNTAATTFTTALNANGGISTAIDTDLTLGASGIGNIIFATDADTGVLIGSESNTPAVLSVSGGVGNNAALIINQLNNGSLLTASSAGVTRFTIDNSGNIDSTGAIALSTGNLAFSSTGGITLTGGTISDATDEVDINDDLAVAGNISLTGTTGITLTGSGADLTFANLEQISNDTNGSFTLRRNDAGTVSLVAADDDATAALTITSGGAAALTLDTGGAATLGVGTTNANAITIGNTTSSTNVTLTKGASGNIILTGFNCSSFTNGGTLTADVNGYLECQNDDGGAATATYWDGNEGALFPNNTTYDLLLGGTSTASAKFGFLNVSNGGIPVATISAAATGDALSLSASGAITTTQGNRLTLGGGDSGEVYTASLLRLDATNGIRGGGLSDCDNPSTAKLLWDSSTNRFACGTDQGGGGGSSMTVRESDSNPAVSAVALLEFGPGSTSSDEFIVTDEGSNTARVRIGNQVGILNQAETVTGGWIFDTALTTFTTSIAVNGGISTATDTDLTLGASGIGNIVLSTDENTGVRIGSASNTPAVLSVSGGIGNNAALIVNQQNSGNIFTASASGTTKFVIDNSGSILLAGGTLSDSSDGVDIADDLDVSGAINLTTGTLTYSSTGGISLAGGSISDSVGSVIVNDNLSIAGTTGISFSSTGGVILAGGTISDSSGAVTINDDVSVSGSTGLTFSNTAAAVIFGNSERISNDTDGTLTFGRNNAGTVTLTAADDDATAALTITSGGAAALTLDTGGSAGLTLGTTNASSVTIGKSTNGTSVTIETGTGGLNIGDTANTKVIEIGGVDTDGADTIRIGTNATSADSFNIGNANSGTTMALTGGDDWSITTAGLATFTKFTGSGLSDCDTATTSKLLWDSTNQTFSCGTDNTFAQSKTFSDTTSDTSVSWTVAADVWDGTQPNLTVTNTNNRVLVSFTANIVTDDATDEQAAIQVRRAIGTTATCTDTAVGEALLGTFLTTASQEQSLSGTFLDTGSFTASDVANYTICTDGHANSLDDGTVLSLTMTLVEVGPAGADLAEVYYSEKSILPGEIVSLDPARPAGVMKSTRAYDGNVLGIVSTQPGIVLGTAENQPGKPVLVALSGRVPVKVSAENGAISPGDLLVSSSIPGIAMKATKPGFVVGQAISGYSGDGVGTVLAFIKTAWYDPDGLLLSTDAFSFTRDEQATSSAALTLVDSAQRTITRIGAFSEVVVGNVRAGYLDVQENITAGMIVVGSVTTDSLSVTTDNITIGGVTIREYLAGIVHEVLDEQAQQESETGLALLETGITDQESRITDLETLFATASAQPFVVASESAVSDTNEIASSLDTRNDELSINNLSVEGLATISANLRVKNNTLIEGILTVIDTLMAKNLIVSGLATFFDDVVFKGAVAFVNPPTFGKDTAGFAVIRKGSSVVDVVFEDEYEQTPVVNASISFESISNNATSPVSKSDEDRQQEIEKAVLGSDVSYIITKRTTKGFSIILHQAVEEDITFSWTAFAVDKPMTFNSPDPTPTLLPQQAGETSLSSEPIQASSDVIGTGEEVSEHADSNP